ALAFNGFAFHETSQETIMPMWELLSVVIVCGIMMIAAAPAAAGDDALRKALMFKASFDETLKPDRGKGTLSTRFNHEKEAGKYVFEKGFHANVFRIAKGKGVAGGGCLEAT